jgi:hypothetical protein
VWPPNLEDLPFPEILDHIIRHPMGWIDGLPVWIPEVRGNELHDEFGIS